MYKHPEETDTTKITTEQYNLTATYRQNHAQSTLSIELIYKKQEGYDVYDLELTNEKLAQMKVDIFNDLEIVYDCLKVDESRIVLPSMGQVRIQGKILLGKKQILKEMTLELKKRKMSESQMLWVMVRDLRAQIKELKDHPTNQKKTSKNQQGGYAPGGDAYEQMANADSSSKQGTFAMNPGLHAGLPKKEEQDQKVECNNQ